MAGIKDMLDNILNPKPKATASSGVGKATTGAAGVGKTTTAAGTSSTAHLWGTTQSLAQQKAVLAKKTHQDFINAAYKAAKELKHKDPWPMIKRAGWMKFTDNRDALYTGPAIDEIEALNPEEKAALKKQLGV